MPKLLKAILFMMIFILIVAAISGIIYLYARHIEPHMIRVKNVEINSQSIEIPISDIKICVFSDTHFSEWYTPKDFQKAVNKMNEASPDIVLFAGDLIDHMWRYEGDVSEIGALLEKISAPFGKFAVYGNHDHGGGASSEYEEIMKSGGFKVLVNEIHKIDELNLSIIGIDDLLIGQGSLDIVSGASPDTYNLTLCHEPDVVDDLLTQNVDLMVSGHTHGGQVRLPFVTKDFLPSMGQNYLRGMYNFQNERNTALYVNPGLGMTKLPFRFMATPEVTSITVKASLG